MEVTTLINLMALADEILGINYGDKIPGGYSELDFHKLSETIFKRLSTLSKWCEPSQVNTEDMAASDDSEDDDCDSFIPLLANSKASDSWKEDGLLNFFYGKLHFYFSPRNAFKKSQESV